MSPRLPGIPPCAMGLPPGCVALVPKEVEPVPCWEVEFEIGRRRYDAQHSAARHALLEMFVPIGRSWDPAYHLALRERASALRTAPAAENGPEPTRVALESASQVIPLPVPAEEVDSSPRALAAGIPDVVTRAIDVCPASLGYASTKVTGPLGVLAGMTFAAVTRASYTART